VVDTRKFPASKKPTPRPLALASQKVELTPHEEVLVGIVEGIEILHEASLTLVERHGRDLDASAIQVEQRLVEMPPESENIDAAELHPLQIASLYSSRQLVELRDDVVV
jgi:hypothetical protein